MKVLFLVVGKTIDKHLIALINDYTERVKHYMPFDVEVIPELKNTKALSPEQQKEREGELLQKQLRDGDHVVLLDEGGFSPAIYALAKDKLSLSKMTFSHQMVRLFFVEQVYRAMTILRGEPYHHE